MGQQISFVTTAASQSGKLETLYHQKGRHTLVLFVGFLKSLTIEQFSIDCHKTKTKVITLTNHNSINNVMNQSEFEANDVNSAMNQSEFEENTCSWRQARVY